MIPSPYRGLIYQLPPPIYREVSFGFPPINRWR